MNEAFDIFFEEKRIDLKAFRETRKELCEELEKIFNQIGPHSFDQQKKFLFNPLRLDFPLDTPLTEKSKPAKVKPTLRKKPVLKTRPVTGTEQENPDQKEKRKAPPLKRPLMKKKDAGDGNLAAGKKKSPPLKRPIMKPKAEEKPKKSPLKKPIMKRKDSTEEQSDKPKKKAPTLKRPIMKPKDTDQ